MTGNWSRNVGTIAAVVVMSVAVVGYFVGLQAPMLDRTVTGPTPGPPLPLDSAQGHDHSTSHSATGSNRAVIPATTYSDMGRSTAARSAAQKTKLADLKSIIDPLAEFKISESEKLFALQLRSLNRAFNGAPPTVPHPVDTGSAESCLACHGEGIKTETLRASKMSHQFLAHCTQCHVESSPQHLPASEFVESTFVGLPAPHGGPRAFEGAPPQIPHTTWMRVDCLSCHGLSGVQGIRTTHPWRQNCQQCHAPAAQLEQLPWPAEPQFLSPPQIQ